MNCETPLSLNGHMIRLYMQEVNRQIAKNPEFSGRVFCNPLELTQILHYYIFIVRTMGFRERGSLLFFRDFFHFWRGASRHDTAYSDP